jgi:hypothetical protein
MDVCLPLFCACVVLCKQRLCDGLSLRSRSPTNFHKIHISELILNGKQTSEPNPSRWKRIEAETLHMNNTIFIKKTMITQPNDRILTNLKCEGLDRLCKRFSIYPYKRIGLLTPSAIDYTHTAVMSRHDERLFNNTHNQKRSRDSSAGIATGYGLDDKGVRVRVPV